MPQTYLVSFLKLFYAICTVATTDKRLSATFQCLLNLSKTGIATKDAFFPPRTLLLQYLYHIWRLNY